MIINNQDNIRKNANFGNSVGALATSTMNFLATNEAIGATTVDAASMVFPRTAIDYTRTPEAGTETLRREVVSCLLYAGLGLFGLAAGFALAPFSSAREYNVPLHKITAGDSEITAMASSWNKALNKGKNKDEVVDSYLREIIDSISGVDKDKSISIISDKGPHKEEIITELKTMLLDEKNGYNFDADKKHKLIQKIIHTTGSSENLELKLHDKTIKTKAADLLDNTYILGRTFMSPKVEQEFKKGNCDKFLNSLKNLNGRKMILGLGVASAFALSMQAINRWMTQKKTGSSGFVAYKGEPGKKDTSFNFQAMKAAATAGMGALMLGSITGFKNPIKNLKNLPRELQFTKIMPNLSQYKLAYGVTIMGRFLASSDQNELRESATRDFLGFASWLIFGDVAARGIAKMFEKSKGVSLLNRQKNDGKPLNLMNSYLKTHEEIIYANSEKNTLGKTVKEAYKSVSNPAKKALKYRNIAQLGGYLVSGLLLGVAIPLFNKAVTDNLQKKKIAEQKITA